MSGRHRPLHGADSAEAWDPRPFRVLVCDRFDEDDRRWIKVASAIGPHDARSQVRTAHPDVSVLTVEEAERLPDRGRMQDEPSYNAIREAS